MGQANMVILMQEYQEGHSLSTAFVSWDKSKVLYSSIAGGYCDTVIYIQKFS